MTIFHQILICSIVTLPLFTVCFQTITGTWNDEAPFIFDENGNNGWSDIGNYDNLIDNPVTNGDLATYHGPYRANAGDGISPQHLLSQQFYCQYPSDITITYKLASCAADSPDYTKFYFNNVEKQTIIGDIIGNNLNDGTLNNLCNDGWETTTKTWPYIGSVTSNQLFEPKWEFKMNTADLYVVYDISIYCDGTANPTLSVTTDPSKYPSQFPTTTPTTASPTQSPTNIPTANTFSPTQTPSKVPSHSPTNIPTETTFSPTQIPSKTPSNSPTNIPSLTPTQYPTQPTQPPTLTTVSPTNIPSATPIRTPTMPSNFPTITPTNNPTKSDRGGEVENETTESNSGKDKDGLSAEGGSTLPTWIYILAVCSGILCCLALILIGCAMKRTNKRKESHGDAFRMQANTELDGDIWTNPVHNQVYMHKQIASTSHVMKNEGNVLTTKISASSDESNGQAYYGHGNNGGDDDRTPTTVEMNDMNTNRTREGPDEFEVMVNEVLTPNGYDDEDDIDNINNAQNGMGNDNDIIDIDEIMKTPNDDKVTQGGIDVDMDDDIDGINNNVNEGNNEILDDIDQMITHGGDEIDAINSNINDENNNEMVNDIDNMITHGGDNMDMNEYDDEDILVTDLAETMQ